MPYCLFHQWIFSFLLHYIRNSTCSDLFSCLFLLAKLLLGNVLKEGTAISLNPLVIWAWAGLLINAINSIPAGELDGGRISFAIWGRKVIFSNMFFQEYIYEHFKKKIHLWVKIWLLTHNFLPFLLCEDTNFSLFHRLHFVYQDFQLRCLDSHHCLMM